MSACRPLLLAACALPLAAVDLGNVALSDQPVAVGPGPRALGMGGAFAAVADDATAAWWNPAGLTQAERPEVSASLGWYASRTSNRYADESAVRPDHAAVLLPFFALGRMQTIGLSWQRQYDYGRSNRAADSFFDGDSTFYVAGISSGTTERRGAVASLGLSYAIELQPGLSLGASISRYDDALTGDSAWRQDYQQTSTTQIYLDGIGFLLDSRDDYDGTISSEVRSGTGATLGLLWQATPHIAVAAVARPASDLEVRVTSAVRQTTYDLLTPGSVTVNDLRSSAEYRLRLPPSATLATAIRPDDLNTVALEATVTRWSDYRVEDANGRRSPLSVHVSPDEFDDLWTLRGGYERIVILPSCVLAPRLGAACEWLPGIRPVPSTAASTTGARRERWLAATAGLGVVQRRMVWDAAVQVRRGLGVGTGAYASLDSEANATLVTARLGLTVHF
jgi:hypothetical protein